MTAVSGVAGLTGATTAPRPASAPSVPPGAATFDQALAAASKAASPASPAVSATSPEAAPSITLGQMLRMSSGPQAPALAPPPQSTAAVSAAAVDASSAPVRDTGMVRPAEGRISSEFGPRIHPVTGERRPHGGIDVAAPIGTPIRAADAGTVTFAGVRGGYGNLVIIDHGGGRETYYAHNNVNSVSAGDRVSAGARIGDIGATGRVTGPHLHFEVRIGGTSVEPRDHVDF